MSKRDRKKETCLIVLCFLLVVVMHEIVNVFMYAPWSMGDELGVLATGAGITGYDWSEVFKTTVGDISEVNFYPGGLGIFLAPLFQCFVDRPFVLYQAILLLTAVIQSLSSVFAYRILYNELGLKKHSYCFIFSVAASFLVTSRATNAMNENALILCTWIIFYTLVILLRENLSNFQKKVYSIALALVLCYSYTVHTRAMILIFATLFLLIFVRFVLNKRFISRVYFFGTLFLGGGLAHIFNEFIKEQIFHVSESSIVYNTSANVTQSIVGQFFGLFKEGKWQAFGDIFLTNILGINIITGGMFLLVFVIWIRLFFEMIRKRDCIAESKFLISGLFLFMSTFGMIALYSIQGLGNTVLALEENRCTRAHFYLRYPGAFLGPLVILIAIVIWKKYLKKSDFIFSIIMMLICFRYTFLSIIPRVGEHGDLQFDYYHYFSPFSFNSFNELLLENDFVHVLVVVLLIFLSLVFLMVQKKKIIFGITIMALFCYQYFYLGFLYDVPNSRELHYSIISSVSLFQENEKLKDTISKVYMPLISGRWEVPYVAQYYLVNQEVIRNMPDKNEKEALILTYAPIEDIEKEYHWSQLEDGTYMYVKGDKYKKILEECGVLLYESE